MPTSSSPRSLPMCAASRRARFCSGCSRARPTHRRWPSWRVGGCVPSGRRSPRRSSAGCKPTTSSCCVSSLPTWSTWMRPSRVWTPSSQRAWPRSKTPSRSCGASRAWPGAPPKCSSPRSARICRASPAPSIWLPGRGCALAMPRAEVDASVGGHAVATLGCGAHWPRSPTSPAGRRAPTWRPNFVALRRAVAKVGRSSLSAIPCSSPSTTCSHATSPTASWGRSTLTSTRATTSSDASSIASSASASSSPLRLSRRPLDDFQESTGIKFSPPGVGKTALLLDQMAHVALDRAWEGHAVHGGHVVYIAAEGQAFLPERLEALLLKLDVADIPRLHILPVRIQLLEPRTVPGLLATFTKELCTPPVWVAFDTVSQTAAGADENDANDMRDYINAMDRIRVATGAFVDAIHHTGKDGSRGARGSSALHGNLDTVIQISDTDGIAVMRCEKQRGGSAPFKPFSYRVTSL